MLLRPCSQRGTAAASAMAWLRKLPVFTGKIATRRAMRHRLSARYGARQFLKIHTMLRLNEVKLPLEHDAAALPAAILARLGITAYELLGFTVFKRSYDAR